MGMCLIGALGPSGIGEWLIVVLQVAAGLGTVIFVHELGHFAVAKACGVKCDKFFIGFDIGGYKISRKWGETEYGIGILPLGGYVKMMGQDDNPANIAEQVRESQVEGEAVDAKEITGPDGEKYLVDRRSYLAKSVLQRMAIISAGVVMNVIFAVIFAVIAFGLGVPYEPSIVSQTVAGSPAWQAGLRPGDDIVRIGDTDDPTFSDLRGNVSLANLEQGVPFRIRRGETTTEVVLKPVKQGSRLPQVGVAPPWSLRIYSEKAALDGSVAAELENGFQSGDEIIAIDGQPVETYGQYADILAQKRDQTLSITVIRGGQPPKDNRFGRVEGGEEVVIQLPPSPMRRLGLQMHLGEIVAVQQGSPAEEANLTAGDFIEQIEDSFDSGEYDALKDWDPITLPQVLQRMAADNRDVRLALRRSTAETGEGDDDDKLLIKLREVKWLEGPLNPNDPVPVTAMGVSYRVLNRVNSVQPGSPAERKGLQSGDVITKVELVYPSGMEDPPKSEPIEFTTDDETVPANNWAGFLTFLQNQPAGTRVKLTYERNDVATTVEMTPEADEKFNNAKRGLLFERLRRTRQAKTFGEQVERGWHETINALGLVYRFLSKIGTQVSVTNLGGPITIAQAAGYSAVDGMGKLLTFLTMLSANLAVINFLPIPLLDGGHMVFLAYEGVRGRPAGEKLVVAMHTIGFVFIISLMLFVISLDVRRLFGLA